MRNFGHTCSWASWASLSATSPSEPDRAPLRPASSPRKEASRACGGREGAKEAEQAIKKGVNEAITSQLGRL